MKAMILAAGRGERLRPLTDHQPKPLVPVNGRPLIEYQIDRLVNAGYRDIVINHSWLGDQIVEQLGDGRRFGAQIRYSHESSPLETGGGIFKALHFMENKPFLVINGDIWTDYPYRQLPGLQPGDLAHLVMVDNPAHNPGGDFCCIGGRMATQCPDRHTFSGIGIYSPRLFPVDAPVKFPLGPLLARRIREGRVSGEVHKGTWLDIGTVARLVELETLLRA